MIFNYLKYLKPIWYFNLKPAKDNGYFPTIEQLEKSNISFSVDENFKSQVAQERDIAWTAFQQGFISKEFQQGINIWEKVKIPVQDEYVFLRKNFHFTWVFYVMIVRIFTFNNPFLEIISFVKTRKVRRIDFHKNHIQYNDYNNFDSDLIKQNPLISVIIPTLNRYEYLKDVLKDLENQTYKNFEVIIVDQTDDFQEEKALWKARNEAIKSSNGTYILMSEDDIEIPNNFIENHLKTIDFFNCDASCGVFFPVGSTIPKERSFFKFAEQFATGNALLKKEIFQNIGLFDRQFEKQRMGDGEFGLRMYLNGFTLVSNPHAFCYDIKAPSGGLRQMGSWDSWRPKGLFSPRPIPSTLYLSRKYFGNSISKYYILHSVLPSLAPYKFKNIRFMKFISLLFIPFILPFICFQIIKSWKLASDKLKEGSKIDDYI